MGKITAIKGDIYSPEYILKHISQEQIFEYYLGIKVDLYDRFCSPLRRDKSPSCSFRWSGSRLRIKDWSINKLYDCFDAICIKYGFSFNEACIRIAHDFHLVRDSRLGDLTPIEFPTDYEEPMRCDIKVLRQHFTDTDKEYLTSYGITSKICHKFYVFSIKQVWLNDNIYYAQDERIAYEDPCIGWYLGNGQWKLYFYKRHNNRFRSNASMINGLRQLPDRGSVLVITKSMKDVMVLDTFNIPAIAPQSESYYFKPGLISQLTERFDRVFSLYDFDYTGIKFANLLRKQYNITPLFLTNGRFGTLDFGAKDISDYIQRFGAAEIEQLINYTISYYDLDSLVAGHTNTNAYESNSNYPGS